MNGAFNAKKFRPGILRWEAFSPAHKVDLCSCAVLGSAGWWVFDPIALDPTNRDLFGDAPLAGIVLTNENHERDAAAWSENGRIPIWSAPGVSFSVPNVRQWEPKQAKLSEWLLFALPGGAKGETAFFRPDLDLMVFGDAVVNLPGRRLELLPQRYCRDAPALAEQVRQLPNFDCAIVAHGNPIFPDAARRIAALPPSK